MKPQLLIALAICTLLLQSCCYYSYEYIYNQSGEKIEVFIHPPVPDSIALQPSNNFKMQGIYYSVDTTENIGKYTIPNKSFLKIGIAYNGIDKKDIAFRSIAIIKNNDTLEYDRTIQAEKLFQMKRFTPKKYSKEKHDINNGTESIGGWVYTVKKPKAVKL